MIARPSAIDRAYIKILDLSGAVMFDSTNTHGFCYMVDVYRHCRENFALQGGVEYGYAPGSPHSDLRREFDNSDFDLLFHGELMDIDNNEHLIARWYYDRDVGRNTWYDLDDRDRKSYERHLNLRDKGEGLSAENPLVFTLVYRGVFVSVSAVKEDGEISDEVLATGFYRNLRDVYYYLRSEKVSLPEVMKGVDLATVEQLHKEVLNDTDKFVTLLPESEYNKFRKSRNGSSNRYNKLRSLVPDYDRNLATFYKKNRESVTTVHNHGPVRLVLAFTNGADSSDDIKVKNDKGRFCVDVVDLSGKHIIKHGCFQSVTEISRYLDTSVFDCKVNFKLLLGSKILCNSMEYKMCIENADDELALSEDKSEDKSAVHLLTLHPLGVKLNRNEEKHFITTLNNVMNLYQLHGYDYQRFLSDGGHAESKFKDDLVDLMKYYERRYFGLDMAGELSRCYNRAREFRGNRGCFTNFYIQVPKNVAELPQSVNGTFMNVRINHIREGRSRVDGLSNSNFELEFSIHESYYKDRGFQEYVVENVAFSYAYGTWKGNNQPPLMLRIRVNLSPLILNFRGKFQFDTDKRETKQLGFRLRHVWARYGDTLDSVVVDHGWRDFHED